MASRLATHRLLLFAGMLLALLALPWVYRTGMHGAALFDGDEAIYAEMAHEMRASNSYAELTFDGQTFFPRPPMAIWTLAVAQSFGDLDTALFVALALTMALGVALTMLLGARLFSVEVGLVGGAILGLSDLWAGYARTYESEPVLVAFVLGAFVCWAAPERTWKSWIGYGVCLGGALLTKQVIGLLPLGALLVDAICRRSLRGAWIGLVTALAIAAPWHVLMIARHGHAFVDSFFLQSLFGRASVALIKRTGPMFYLHTLVESEGWGFAIALLASATCALIVGLRRRAHAPLLVGGWAIGTLVVYSLSRSRYDYYALLAYPALALSLAFALSKVSARARIAISIAGVVAAALLHLPRNLLPIRGDEDVRTLLAGTESIAPGAPIYTFNRYPYTARVYSGRHVFVLVQNERELSAASQLQKTGMPAPAILARGELLDAVVRPSLLLFPSERDVPGARRLGESGALTLWLAP